MAKHVQQNEITGYFGRSNAILDDFVTLLSKQASDAQAAAEVNKEAVVKQFEDFEKLVKSNPEMVKVFAALQQKFADDPEYAASVDKRFVEGVMLLDLSLDEQE